MARPGSYQVSIVGVEPGTRHQSPARGWGIISRGKVEGGGREPGVAAAEGRGRGIINKQIDGAAAGAA